MPVDASAIKRLQMPDPDEIKAEVEAQAKAAETTEKKPDPMGQEEYTWDFEWTNPSGTRSYKGTFTNKVLTQGEKRLVALMRARMIGGMPTESVDGRTMDSVLITAHLSFSLLKKPEWMNNTDKLHDVRVLDAIYEVVLKHEATFLG